MRRQTRCRRRSLLVSEKLSSPRQSDTTQTGSFPRPTRLPGPSSGAEIASQLDFRAIEARGGRVIRPDPHPPATRRARLEYRTSMPFPEQENGAQQKTAQKARSSVPRWTVLDGPMVPKERIELSRGVASADFESAASTVPPLRRGAAIIAITAASTNEDVEAAQKEARLRGPDQVRTAKRRRFRTANAVWTAAGSEPEPCRSRSRKWLSPGMAGARGIVTSGFRGGTRRRSHRIAGTARCRHNGATVCFNVYGEEFRTKKKRPAGRFFLTDAIVQILKSKRMPA